MKDIYTKKLSSEENNKSIVTEPVMDTYIAQRPQGCVSGLGSIAEYMPPCTLTDEEMQNMLEDTEKENLFIPDSLVRKMFA